MDSCWSFTETRRVKELPGASSTQSLQPERTWRGFTFSSWWRALAARPRRLVLTPSNGKRGTALNHIPKSSQSQRNQDVDLPFLERFQKHCGRGNLLLQAKLKKLKKDHPHAVRLWYSRARLPKSMTVRRPEDLMRAHAHHHPPSCPRRPCEINPHLAQALSQEGLPLVDGLLKIPDEGDLDFVSRVIRALKTTLGFSANDEGPPRAGTETTFWDSLEKLTGSIECRKTGPPNTTTTFTAFLDATRTAENER